MYIGMIIVLHIEIYDANNVDRKYFLDRPGRKLGPQGPYLRLNGSSRCP